MLEILQHYCESAIEERASPRYRYPYRFATLKNNQNEPLNVHISWPPRYGPDEMIMHVDRVLEEYQPRISIMTGICAGDPQSVQLGDLVVAERVFASDNGKYKLDEQGQSVHAHDTLTYEPDAAILQFLGLFNDWEALLARLERPPSPSELILERLEVRCSIKAMASGSAVRADSPFKDIQIPVRGAIAYDMEGAAFGKAMSRYHLTHWLVVKGVCDYADGNKNDVYHGYAARASALYALSFIRAYVTEQMLPKSSGRRLSESTARVQQMQHVASQVLGMERPVIAEGLPQLPASVPHSVLPTICNIPHSRNHLFTGRDEILTGLHDAFQSNSSTTLIQAITGLGGVGKTQIAIEYFYRYQKDYAQIFWINCSNFSTISNDIAKCIEALNMFEHREQDQTLLINAFKDWLQTHQNWLLILDNVDDVALIQNLPPPNVKGHTLITTRTQNIIRRAFRIPLDVMGINEGAFFLLRRAGILDPRKPFEEAALMDQSKASGIVRIMGGLPLALEQAGAYIEATSCTLTAYLEYTQTRQSELLLQSDLLPSDYPHSVMTTWSLSFDKVKKANPAAADLLYFCAFLVPDDIPEELFAKGAKGFSPRLQAIVADPLKFDNAIKVVEPR